MNDIKNDSGNYITYPVAQKNWDHVETLYVGTLCDKKVKKSIGVPIENKPQENRVALTPESVKKLTSKGIQVNVSRDVGKASGFIDDDYFYAGATVFDHVEDVYRNSEIIVKVKEPYKEQINMLEDKHTLFCYLHLAANPELAEMLKNIGPNFKAIAFESIVRDGKLPLLKPMSEVAGKLSVQVGLQYLHVHNGGYGLLLGGVTGTERGNVVILGAGVAGYNAAQVASGLGANVLVFDIDSKKLENVQKIGANVTGLLSSEASIEKALKTADIAIGTVLVPNCKTPYLVTEKMVMRMRPGSVIVDVSADQGGCFETTRPTTHENPTYIKHDVVHYAVTNMPGAVPKTSTIALNNSIFPYVEKLSSSELTYKSSSNLLQSELCDAINIGTPASSVATSATI